MRVLKFGGTSVGTAQKMRDVLSIINEMPGQKMLVLSAMAGTTNALASINDQLYDAAYPEAMISINEMHAQYETVCQELFVASSIHYARAKSQVDRIFDDIRSLCDRSKKQDVSKILLAQGELLSTALFYELSLADNLEVALLPALDFMRLDEKSEPFIERTSALLRPIMQQVKDKTLLITQGYICRNHWEEIDNLRRGGSDYTATILGAILESEEIQIWTDIDGIHNNDPRIVNDTSPIRQMSYREAAELAYFGAKILHPTCVLPAEEMSVPVRLKYTSDPKAEGTIISDKISNKAITAIAAKDGITTINIYSSRMLMAYGFLKKVFQVFEDHKTPVDMITTSEVAVTLTVDYLDNIDKIKSDLEAFAEVSIKSDYTIICIVGNELYDNSQHVNNIFNSLKKIPIRMVSMGGSRHNVSLLLKTEYKREALISLNSIFKV